MGTGVRRSTLERMPKWLICVPLVVQWLWLALRHGSATLPSAANPAITAGGLVGETKTGILQLHGARGPRRDGAALHRAAGAAPVHGAGAGRHGAGRRWLSRSSPSPTWACAVSACG